METTRDQVLRLVRGRREATVGQVAAALGLSQPAVRRHLDGLRADGLVDVRLGRHGVGRPSLVFFPTEQAEELAGRQYLRLLTRVFRSLDRMGEAEVSASSGAEILERAMAGVALEVAAEHRPEVRGRSLGERVAETGRALRSEGILDAWEQEGTAFRLVNHDCPYLKVAEVSAAPCHSDRQAIELLVGAAVEQVRRIVDGAPVCEYVVAAAEEEKTPWS